MNEQNNDTPSNIDDAKTMMHLINKHKGWVIGLFSIVAASSAGVSTVYGHFAKHDDLVTTICERQAIDLDIELQIERSKNEVILEYAGSILDMFQNTDPNGQSESTRIWTAQFRNLEKEHAEKLKILNRVPSYFTPSVIRKCKNSVPPIVEPHNLANRNTFN